jgi:hypothetical protein
MLDPPFARRVSCVGMGRSILTPSCAAVLLLATGCTTVGIDPCDNADGALSNASFVILAAPDAGDRVASGFGISGCSRTFESNVVWRLIAENGDTLASGNTIGGGVDGYGPFADTVSYSVPARQIGHLEVFEEDVSDGEGNPPGRNVIPLVLSP